MLEENLQQQLLTEVSKLAKVKAQVSEVKGVMMENIEKVLDRGEKSELLVDKTENLRSQGFLVFLYSLESLEPCSTDAAESGTRTCEDLTREREREALEINMEKRLLIICGKKLKKMLKLFGKNSAVEASSSVSSPVHCEYLFLQSAGKKDHCFNFRSDIDPFMAGSWLL
ncbi:hypothetical protein ACOSQ3_002802 [Xanthoceras sorbifolium]